MTAEASAAEPEPRHFEPGRFLGLVKVLELEEVLGRDKVDMGFDKVLALDILGLEKLLELDEVLGLDKVDMGSDKVLSLEILGKLRFAEQLLCTNQLAAGFAEQLLCTKQLR